MKQQIANYTVIVEKQKRLGTNKYCYMAFVPLLGIATEADTLEKAEKEIKSLIKFHLECLVEEKEIVPVEKEPAYITRSEVVLPSGAVLSF